MTTNLRTQIDDVLDSAAADIARLATGPQARQALAGSITANHDRFVAATAARTALDQAILHGSAHSGLDAATAPELRQAVAVLSAARVATASILGDRATELVSQMVSAATRLLEAELAPAAS